MFNPLEQFELKIFYPIVFFNLFDLSFTNAALYLMLALFLLIFLYFIALSKSTLIPNKIQYILESLYTLIYDMAKQQIGVKSQEFFSIIFTYFALILILNLLGLNPFSFTVTSHITFTFALGFSAWLAVVLIGVTKHKLAFLKIFLPAGAPVFLIPLLVFIEIVSYVSRTFSLSIRLFANMMSGHTLLYILSGFAFKIASNLFFLAALPVIIVVLLVAMLEFGIAFLQAYVFVVLFCIYLNDSYTGGH